MEKIKNTDTIDCQIYNALHLFFACLKKNGKAVTFRECITIEKNLWKTSTKSPQKKECTVDFHLKLNNIRHL